MSELDGDLIIDESPAADEIVDDSALDEGDLAPLAKRRLIENRLEDMRLKRELEYYEYID